MSAASGDGAAAPPSIQTTLPASHFAAGDVCPPFLFPLLLSLFSTAIFYLSIYRTSPFFLLPSKQI